MNKIIILTDEQIQFYEKMSGGKIDINATPDKKHVGFYYIVKPSGEKRWRRGSDILQYINAKINKTINNSVTEINNNLINNSIVFNKKEIAYQKSICLTKNQIEKVKRNARYYKISFSNVIGQLIDKNL